MYQWKQFKIYLKNSLLSKSLQPIYSQEFLIDHLSTSMMIFSSIHSLFIKFVTFYFLGRVVFLSLCYIIFFQCMPLGSHLLPYCNTLISFSTQGFFFPRENVKIRVGFFFIPLNNNLFLGHILSSFYLSFYFCNHWYHTFNYYSYRIWFNIYKQR